MITVKQCSDILIMGHGGHKSTEPGERQGLEGEGGKLP